MAASGGETHLARFIAALHWLVQHGGCVRRERPPQPSAPKSSHRTEEMGLRSGASKPLREVLGRTTHNAL
eukprot:7385421-Prymnesium_polylepis.2